MRQEPKENVLIRWAMLSTTGVSGTWSGTGSVRPEQALGVTTSLHDSAARPVSFVSKAMWHHRLTTTTAKVFLKENDSEESAYNPLFFRDWELKEFCSPPSLSLLSAQAVSMATLHPGPLQPLWQTHCQLFWPSVHRPLPLHRSGQPSGWRNGEGKHKTHSLAPPLRRVTILLCRQKGLILLVGQTLPWPRATALGWRRRVEKGDTSVKWGFNSSQKRGGFLPSAYKS